MLGTTVQCREADVVTREFALQTLDQRERDLLAAQQVPTSTVERS